MDSFEAPSGTVTPKMLKAKLEQGRIELLDLSSRNRLLNVPRKSKTAKTIEVIDELSSEVYRLLVTDGKAFTFLSGRRKAGGSETEDGDELDAADLAQPEDDNVSEGRVASRHSDMPLRRVAGAERLPAGLPWTGLRRPARIRRHALRRRRRCPDRFPANKFLCRSISSERLIMAVYLAYSPCLGATKLGYTDDPYGRQRTLNQDTTWRDGRKTTACAGVSDWRIEWLWKEGKISNEQALLELIPSYWLTYEDLFGSPTLLLPENHKSNGEREVWIHPFESFLNLALKSDLVLSTLRRPNFVQGDIPYYGY